MEKSIEYMLLGKINFQGSKYNVYVDNKYRKFYLKIIDSDKSMNLIYPTLEEFISLNKLFGMNYISNVNYFIDKNNSDYKLSESKRVRFIPKVMTKTGLISLASAIFLSGCGVQNISASDTSDATSTIVETINTEEATNTEEVASTEETTKQKTIKEMTDEEILEYYGYPISKMEDGIFALNRIKSNGESYTVCKNVNEFKKYTEMEGKPSYDDLLKAIENNETITGRYEDWFKEAINNLSQNEDFKDVDFSVLLYNIQRMKIEEKTTEQILEGASRPFTKAYFNLTTKQVAVNPDTVTQVVFLHEVLGHACTQTITEENIIFESQTVLTVLDRTEDGNVNDISSIVVGRGIEEGKADMIAEIALNGSVKSTSSYDIEKETFREFKEILGLTWDDVINNSMALKIISKMAELGMNDSIKYVDNADTLCYVGIFEDFDDDVRFKNNMGQFLLDYAQSQIKSGENMEDVLNKISQTIQESPEYQSSIGLATVMPKDITNMKEFEEYVLSLIEESQNIEKEPEQDDNELMY